MFELGGYNEDLTFIKIYGKIEWDIFIPRQWYKYKPGRRPTGQDKLIAI